MKYIDWQSAQYRQLGRGLGMIATSPSLKAKLWQQFRLWAAAWLFPFTKSASSRNANTVKD